MIISMRSMAFKSVFSLVIMGFLAVPSKVLSHPSGGGKPVNLKVNSAGDALEMNTPESKCINHPQGRPDFVEPGCLRFQKNNSDTVRFSLVGANKVCDDTTMPDTDWKLNGVQLGPVNQDTKPAWQLLMPVTDPKVVLDFDVNAGTGWVSYTEPTPNSIEIANLNMSQNGYSIWYRVRATCPTGAKAPIYFDPRFDNEGND